MIRTPGRLGVVGLAALLTVATWFDSRPATASTFSVVSVTYSSSTVTVTGLQTAPLTVTVHVTSTPAIATDNGYLTIDFKTTSIPVSYLQTGMNLLAGSGTDGTWAATMLIPAPKSGTYVPYLVYERGSPGPEHPITGFAGFTVVGTHAPHVSTGQAPNPVLLAAPFTVKGRVIDGTTGVGIPGVRISHGVASGDSMYYDAVVLTNSLGYYGFPPQTSVQAHSNVNAAVIRGPVQSDGTEVVIAYSSFDPMILPAVSAAPASSRVPVGTVVQVNGKVTGTPTPAAACPVALQRLTGATQWRGVSLASVRASGRYTLLAQPSVMGRNIYRTLFPRCSGDAQATSTPFAITAY